MHCILRCCCTAPTTAASGRAAADRVRSWRGARALLLFQRPRTHVLRGRAAVDALEQLEVRRGGLDQLLRILGKVRAARRRDPRCAHPLFSNAHERSWRARARAARSVGYAQLLPKLVRVLGGAEQLGRAAVGAHEVAQPRDVLPHGFVEADVLLVAAAAGRLEGRGGVGGDGAVAPLQVAERHGRRLHAARCARHAAVTDARYAAYFTRSCGVSRRASSWLLGSSRCPTTTTTTGRSQLAAARRDACVRAS